MTHGINAHETAAYAVQTGRTPGDRLVYPAPARLVSLLRGYNAGYTGLIPPYIVLSELQGRFSESGFLGPRYARLRPAVTRLKHRSRCRASYPGITEERQRSRRDLLAP